MLWPDGTKSRPWVSSPFGPRKAPIAGASTNHKGTDFSNTFTLIRAVAPGRVVAINVWPALGYSVWIQHDGYFTKSGHMKNQPIVKVGQTVGEGQILGVMGKTGTATDTHLHFELTPGTFHTANTGQIDPVPFISARLGSTAGGSTPEEEDMGTLEGEQGNALMSLYNAFFKGGGDAGDVPLIKILQAIQGQVNGAPDVLKAIKDQVNGVPTVLSDIRKDIAKVGVSDAQVKLIADAVAKQIGTPTVQLDYAAIRAAVKAELAALTLKAE